MDDGNEEVQFTEYMRKVFSDMRLAEDREKQRQKSTKIMLKYKY